jgi:hypothetical protein
MRALEEILKELRSAMREQGMRSLVVYAELSSGKASAQKEQLKKTIVKALGTWELSTGASLANAVRDIWPPNSGKWPTNLDVQGARIKLAELGVLTVNPGVQLTAGPKVELTEIGWKVYREIKE